MKGCACLSPTVEVKGQPGAQPPLALSSLLAKNDLEILILAAMDHHGMAGLLLYPTRNLLRNIHSSTAHQSSKVEAIPMPYQLVNEEVKYGRSIVFQKVVEQ